MMLSQFPCCGEVDGLPYAVVGSNVVVEDGAGRRYRGRQYPWGSIDIENQAHSDFTALRRMLLVEHTAHMIQTTVKNVYENYRYEILVRMRGERMTLETGVQVEERDTQEDLEQVEHGMERGEDKVVKPAEENCAGKAEQSDRQTVDSGNWCRKIPPFLWGAGLGIENFMPGRHKTVQRHH